MGYQIPDREPSTLIAGDTWRWTVSLPDFPAGQGYTATYQFTGKTSLGFTATPNVSDGTYSVSVPSSSTSVVGAGPYRWALRVTDDGSNVLTARSGHVLVLANPAVSSGADASSHAEQMLALIEAELQARVTGSGASTISYSIEGRSITKMTLAELYSLRAKYKGEVSRQANGGRSAPIKIAFGSRR